MIFIINNYIKFFYAFNLLTWYFGDLCPTWSNQDIET